MPFKIGQSGNPAGRPRGSKSNFSYARILEAISIVEEKEKIDVFVHFIDRALKSDVVLVALMKKILPDRKEFEGELKTQELSSRETLINKIPDFQLINICKEIIKKNEKGGTNGK